MHMSAARGSIGGWIVGVLTMHLLAAFNLYADVIYLKDGSILLAEQAWEEGDEVKYRTRQGILSLPKASVQEIRPEKPMPPAAGASRWVRVSPDGPGSQAGSATAAAPSAPAVTGGTGEAISKEALTRLRNNLNSDRSDPIAKSELAQALNSMAALQVAQGDLASAQSSLEEALEIDRRNPALLSNLGAVHFRMGNYQKTESLLLECLEIDRKDQRTFLKRSPRPSDIGKRDWSWVPMMRFRSDCKRPAANLRFTKNSAC
jgi:tetratricopeptide (TPR) repeat protein